MGKDQARVADVIEASAADIIAIGAAADDIRRRLHGTRTTFVRVFEIHVDAIPASLPSSLAMGEIRIAGKPQTPEAAVDAVRRIRGLAGPVPMSGFALHDLTVMSEPLQAIAARLREAGLDAIAEVPVDVIQDPAPVLAARVGGLEVTRLTVNSAEGTTAPTLIERAIALQRAAAGFRVFAPLPRVISLASPTTGYDDVKAVAASRIMAEDIPSIQVDWNLYGPKLAQVALTMGADDVDGVAAFDPAPLGARRSALAEIIGNIRAAGLDPVERNGRFEVI